MGKIAWHEEAKCLECGGRAIGGYTHPRCRGKLSLDRSLLLAHHRGPVRKLLLGLKYKKWSSMAEFVAELMVKRLVNENLEGFVVVPVPLHYSKTFKRGFNQAEVVGENLARKLGLGYRGDWLVRVRNTETQTELDKGARSQNVRQAFRINSREGLKGAKALLLDDVITTGATARECGRVLKRAGARAVWAVALGNG